MLYNILRKQHFSVLDSNSSYIKHLLLLRVAG